MTTLTKTFLIICFWAGTGFSQQGTISIESKVDRAKITIGDRITYSIIIKKADNVEVVMPEVGANLGAFEILGYEDPEPEMVDGLIEQKREYIISTFDTGEFEIPPVTVQFVSKPDTNWKALTTEKIKVVVESLKPSEAGDIRDIKPPLELERDIKAIIRLVAAGLSLLLIGILIFYIIKRRKEGKSLIPMRVKPPRPAHELALEALEKLVGSGLLAKGKTKQFYIELSDIVRRYIEGRFYIIALEMTTAQLLQNMRDEEIEENIIELSSEFLDSCDLVKFAKYKPEDEETQKAIQQAYDIVNLTTITIAEPEDESDTSEDKTEETEEVKRAELATEQPSDEMASEGVE